LTLTQSTIDNKNIPDSTRAIVDLRKSEDGNRIVNIISDLADITLQGNFTITNAVSILSSEAEILSKAATEKINQIFGVQASADELNKSIKEELKTNQEDFKALDSLTSIKYNIEFKDFTLLSILMGNNQLEIDGEINGEIINKRNNLSITLNTVLDYIKYWGENDVFFLSNFEMNLDVENNTAANSLKDISANLKLNTKRIFMGSDITDLNFDLKLENNIASVDFSSKLEDYLTAKLSSKIDLNNTNLKAEIDTLGIVYNQFNLENKNKIEIDYSQDKIDIHNFNLSNKSSELLIDGTLIKSGGQDLKITLKNINGKDLSTGLLQLRPENSLDAILNLTANIKGDFAAPLIDINLGIDSIKYKGTNFGRLKGDFNYKDKILLTNIRFLNPLINQDSLALQIKGNIPIDLSFESVEERLISSRQIDLTLTADNFNLGAFGDVLPAVNKLRGSLNANVNIKGTPDKFITAGELNLTDAGFIAEANNLEYNAALKVTLAQDKITIDNFMIENVQGTPRGGRMTGSGSAILNNFNVASFEVEVSGDLKALSQGSKSASPSVYGDLVIGTNGAVKFVLNENGALLKAPVTIKYSKLTFAPAQTAYTNNSPNYIYKFAKNSSDTLNKEIDFESLVEMSRQRSERKESGPSKPSKFDYSIDVNVEDEATIIFVLSKEFNQDLTAVLSGDFKYENINNRTNAQGELKLLEGSSLEFIKTLQATGTIRFESELSNPYLDITATYSDYYRGSATTATTTTGSTAASSSSNSSGEEKPVEVRIKIKGFLKDLDKTLIQDKDNIAVYIGQQNIDNNQADPTRDATDAITFLLLGKFRDDTSPNDQNRVAGYTSSLAGSVLGGLLNKQFGDVVKSIEVRQSGSQTKFNLVGQVGKFKYSFGGATNVLQDVGQADLKIEYPLTTRFSLRIERKQSLVDQQSNTTEMINELGLKYRFEF
ncbi:MAG: hypothetical protein ABI550_02270, partial [Ignavibacteriaceae bacterium]